MWLGIENMVLHNLNVWDLGKQAMADRLVAQNGMK
jgi:hypothetical protein